MNMMLVVTVSGLLLPAQERPRVDADLERNPPTVLRMQAKGAGAIPSDYRKRAAAIIKGRTNFKIRDGQISKPHTMWAGLLHGGHLPGVCALIFRENPFGMVVRDTWQITFKNGAIAAASYANASCEHTSKFHEVLER